MIIDSSTASQAAALAPLLSIIAAFLTPLLSHTVKRSSLFAFLFSEIIFIINYLLTDIVFVYVFKTGAILTYMFAGFPPPFGIIYEVDFINAFLGFLVGLIFPIVNIVSYSYLEKLTKNNEWYYTIYLGLEAGLLGIAYTGDLFNLFVMLEVMSISAYALTAYLREKGTPLNAAIKYGLIGAVGSTIYFIAVILLYSGLGTLTMADVAADAIGVTPSLFYTQGVAFNPAPVLGLFLVLSVWAFLIETAIVPHHFWLPDAYSSMPAPAAATMAAVAEGVGLYVITRIIYVIVGLENAAWILYLLLVLGSLNIIIGGYLMATSNDLKRLIAYSTILDMGYAVIGLGLANEIGVSAAFYYILAHAFVKPLLFISVGAIELHTGSTSLDAVQGIMKSNPIVGLGLIIGGLAVIGVPPLNLFFAKLMLFQGVLEKGYTPLLIILLLGSALALVGFTRLWYCTCTRKRIEAPKPTTTKPVPIPFEFKVAIIMLILGVVLTGVLYGYLRSFILDPISYILVTKNQTYRISYITAAYNLFRLIRGG